MAKIWTDLLWNANRKSCMWSVERSNDFEWPELVNYTRPCFVNFWSLSYLWNMRSELLQIWYIHRFTMANLSLYVINHHQMGVGHTNHCKILRVKLCTLKLVEDYHVYLHIMYTVNHKNVAVYFWLVLTDFYSFYIILIAKKFYMRRWLSLLWLSVVCACRVITQDFI